jgi:hypothetical protein
LEEAPQNAIQFESRDLGAVGTGKADEAFHGLGGLAGVAGDAADFLRGDGIGLPFEEAFGLKPDFEDWFAKLRGDGGEDLASHCELLGPAKVFAHLLLFLDLEGRADDDAEMPDEPFVKVAERRPTKLQRAEQLAVGPNRKQVRQAGERGIDRVG